MIKEWLILGAGAAAALALLNFLWDFYRARQLSAGQIMRPRRGTQFWMITIATLSACLGAAASVAVFLLPSADGRAENIGPPPTPVATTTQGQSTVKATPGNTKSRPLASMIPLAGDQFTQVKGSDLQIKCASNQGTDTFHDVIYIVPRGYAEISSRISLSGTADENAVAGIQLIVHRRIDGGDVQAQLGSPIIIGQATSATFTRELGDAVTLTIRVTCQTASQIVTLTGALLTS